MKSPSLPLLIVGVFVIVTPVFSSDVVDKLFFRLDENGDGDAGVEELKREYERNALPLTPGYEFLIGVLDAHLALPPHNQSSWVHLYVAQFYFLKLRTASMRACNPQQYVFQVSHLFFFFFRFVLAPYSMRNIS